MATLVLLAGVLVVLGAGVALVLALANRDKS